jgi:serine/threonine protein kinase
MVKPFPYKFGTAFSNYESRRVIGEGGSGYVYEVRDETNQIYALKILKKNNITQEKRKRFKNEILFCQRNSHPNIITILDYGFVPDNGEVLPFYVMPYYDSSLRYLINNGLTPDVIVKLFIQILDGVEAAHLNGIVHRDIKPENILYRASDSKLAIADFGIARFKEDELYTAVETNSQARLANFQYAAPEQRIRGKEVESRSDIFAIGLILNEMFTHEIPQGTGYKTISSIISSYSYLDDVVEKMIRQSPNERFDSINEIKQFLKIKSEESISEQKLSELRSAVISKSEIDDPLILTPLKIVDFEWNNGQLTLIFNQQTNPKWCNSLHNMGSHTSVYGRGPENFSFNSNRATINAREDEVQRIIDYFKTWIPLATNRYQQEIENESHRKEEQETMRIKSLIEEEERKKRLRANIRL